MQRSRILLRGLSSPFEGLEWESPRQLRIGRLDDLEIILNVPSVSRRHAEVVLTSHGWVVRDLGSMNGTFLNGVRVGRADQNLRLEDAIQFGDVVLQVAVLDEPAPAANGNHRRIKTTGSFVRVQAVAQHPDKQAGETSGLSSSQLAQDRGFQTLQRTGYHVSHIASLDELLPSVLEDAVAVLNAQRGAIVLAEEGTGPPHLQAVAIRGAVPPEKSFSKTLAQRCFDEGQSLLCQDVPSDVATGSARGPMASIICALLRTPRKRLGVLHLDRAVGQEPFTRDDFCLADAIAASIAVGIESAQLMKQQQDFSIHTVTALAQAVELRDEYTGGHTQRVTTYSLMLAEELRLPEEDLRLLRIGVPLHDIGKIGINDAILRKPGKLTREEFEHMKTHTVKGAAILETIPNMAGLIPIVRSHHERWDGQGYPDGLAHEAISRLARIVAVADAFDAMTSDRPYRPALPLEQAFAELTQKAGSHFDPECVQAFLRLRSRIEAMLAQEGWLQEHSEALARTFLNTEIAHEVRAGRNGRLP